MAPRDLKGQRSRRRSRFRGLWGDPRGAHWLFKPREGAGWTGFLTAGRQSQGPSHRPEPCR